MNYPIIILLEYILCPWYLLVNDSQVSCLMIMMLGGKSEESSDWYDAHTL